MRGQLRPPLEVVMTWPPRNAVDPDYRGPHLTIVNITLASFSTLIVLTRLYARYRLPASRDHYARRYIQTKTQLGSDDILITIGTILALGLTVNLELAQKYYYLGRHIWDAPASLAAPSRRNTWNSQFIHIYSATAVRISILLFYRRLGAKVSAKFLIATWAVIAYNILYLLTFTFDLLFQCRPTKSYWLSWSIEWLALQQEFHCHPEGYSAFASSILSGIADLCTTILPMFLLRYLQLPFYKLCLLAGLFGMGFFVVAACVIKTIFMVQLINAPKYDYNWVFWKYWIWHMVELYLLIICASMPALASLANRWFQRPAAVQSLRDYTFSSEGTLAGGSITFLDKGSTH